jgi:hypothetical protein
VVAGLSVEERVVEGHGKDGKSSKSAIGRLCFDEVAGREGIEAMKKLDPERYQALFTKFLSNGAALRTFSPKCGESWKTVMSKDDRLTMRVSGIEFEIVPRSPYGMYQFLGKLMAQGARPPSDGVTPPGGDELPLVSTVADDSKIINIRLGGGPDCFITTMFRDGEYCVPNDAANTKRIIGLLAALTALQTTATDLAITPVVHTAN